MPENELTVGTDECEAALAPGTKLLNANYKIDRYLSAGGFGITYLATDSLQRKVVIKECFPEAVCSRKHKTVCARSRALQSDFRSFVTLFVREARSLSKLNHPNVVGVHQVFEDNDTAYMALDLVDGNDLLTVIEDPKLALSPNEISDILVLILDAVEVIHSKDMLHRDISPDNILIDKTGAPILIDFGAAREEASKKSRTLSSVLVVKDGYSPQEFYFGGSLQGPFSDIYALGASFYHLVSGDPPPHSQARLSEIAAGNPDPCVPLAGRFPKFGDAFLSAIDKAISVFPKDRFQSALDWRDVIKGKAAPLKQAAVTENILIEVSALVAEEAKSNDRQTVQKGKNVVLAERREAYSLDIAALSKHQPKRRLFHAPIQKTAVIQRRVRRPFGRALAMATVFYAVLLCPNLDPKQGLNRIPTQLSTASIQVWRGFEVFHAMPVTEQERGSL